MQTDGHDGANSRFFHNFANTPKKRRLRTVAKYKTRQCGSYNCKKIFVLCAQINCTPTKRVDVLMKMWPNIAQSVHRTQQESYYVFYQQRCHFFR